MKPVLHLRSVRANLVRVGKAMERNDAKVLLLLKAREELQTWKRMLEGQLPLEERPVETTIGDRAKVDWKGEVYHFPDTHEQPGVDLKPGDMVLRVEVASPFHEKRTDTLGAPSPSDVYYKTAVGSMSTDPPSEQPSGTTATAHGELVEPRKRGRPLGLTRTKTPCPHSSIPHRHRINGDDMTCVGIMYP